MPAKVCQPTNHRLVSLLGGTSLQSLTRLRNQARRIRDGSEGFATWWALLPEFVGRSGMTSNASLVCGSPALRNQNTAFAWDRKGTVLFSPFISDNARGMDTWPGIKLSFPYGLRQSRSRTFLTGQHKRLE